LPHYSPLKKPVNPKELDKYKQRYSNKPLPVPKQKLVDSAMLNEFQPVTHSVLYPLQETPTLMTATTVIINADDSETPTELIHDKMVSMSDRTTHPQITSNGELSPDTPLAHKAPETVVPKQAKPKAPKPKNAAVKPIPKLVSVKPQES